MLPVQTPAKRAWKIRRVHVFGISSVLIFSIVALLSFGTLIAILSLGGSNGDTWIYRGNAERTGVLAGDRPVDTDNVLWETTIGGHASPAAVANGSVYVIGEPDTLVALEQKTGTELWKIQNDDEFVTEPVVYGEAVFLGSKNGFFYSFDAQSGEIRWKVFVSQKKGNTIGRHPVFANDLVILSSWDIDLIAFDAKTGKEEWQYSGASASARTNGLLFSPAFANGVIYGAIGNDNMALYAVDSTDGKEKWKSNMTVQSSPSVYDGKVFFADTEGLKAVDALSGRQVNSSFDASSTSDYPVLGSGAIYTFSDYFIGSTKARRLEALDVNTGKQLWEFSTSSTSFTDPVLHSGILYYCFSSGYDENAYLRAIDADSGEDLWSFSTSEGTLSTPAVKDSVVYVKDDGGTVFALGNPLQSRENIADPAADIRGVDWETEINDTKGMSRIEKVYYWDLTGDGYEEAFVLERMDGTGAMLNIYIYAYQGNNLVKLFTRETVPKGGLEPDFENNSFVIKKAAPDGDEPNCCPRNFMNQTYMWSAETLSFVKTAENLVPSTLGWER